MHRLLIALLFCLLVPPGGHAETLLRGGGNGTGLEVIKTLVPAFEKDHPGIKVQVMKSLGSSGGIKALNGGALDMAMTSRPLKADEANAGAELVFLAHTPFIFMANSSVTKANITTKEAEGIYDGTISRWPDGTQIKLVLRPAGDTDTRTMRAISPGMDRALDTMLNRAGMLVALTDEDSDQYVSQLAGALGGSSLAQVAAGRLSCRILSFNGVQPTLQNMASGAYPLTKEIGIALNRNRPGAAKTFIDFVRSSKGSALLARAAAYPGLKTRQRL